MLLQLTWIIRSYDDFQAYDEFVVEKFRLRLTGCFLTVEPEEVNDDVNLLSTASELAYRYFAVLRKHVQILYGLMTFEEYAAIEPMFLQNVDYEGATTADVTILADGVRLARRDMLVLSDPHLRQGYDYLERARDDGKNQLFHLYKFVETLEHFFGGETNLIKALNVKTAVKTLKRLANDKQHDERHAPNASGGASRLSGENQSLATNCAYEILRAYEKSL